MGKQDQRTFSEEFERNAVQRAEAGGHSFTQISRELGIHSSLLQVWRKKYASTEVSSEKSVSSESVGAELRRLRRENASERRSRDLKKAAAGSTDQRNIASSVSAGVRYDKVFRGLPFSLCAMAVR